MHRSLLLNLICVFFYQNKSLCKADNKSKTIPIGNDGFIVELSSQQHFCNAAESCAIYGHRIGIPCYLTGRDYQVVFKHVRGTGNSAWTSLSQLLLLGTNPYIWLDGDLLEARLLVYVNTFSWISGLKVPSHPMAVYFYDKEQLDPHPVTSADSPDVFCEYWNTNQPSLFSERFSQKVPKVLMSLVHDRKDMDACRSSATSETLLACIWSCARRFECRSVYYNQASSNCVQILYVDSLLPHEYGVDENSWIRYARVPKEYLED
ncbi:hypothetical protein FGIG_02812 [Fasciola gigantica]|uniref:Apple domain-containing protein n=1 Tax=Fasciola gigantica TaxID=46835 RepID=A0A504YG81_FASGI|nr:hypothetical protein FGIG_02812 [Fasciola gigantica]